MQIISTSKRRSCLAMIVLCMAWGGNAQANTLPEFVKAALTRLPDLALVDAERNFATALQRKAKQLLADDPSFNLKYQSDAFNNDLGYREWEGGVDLPLWWPGQAKGHKHEAERTLEVAVARGKAKRLEVTGKVRERLWDLAIAQSELDQAQAALHTAEQLARDVERRVTAGELPRSDAILTEKEREVRVGAKTLAQSRLARAQYRFAHFTGVEEVPVAQIEPVSIQTDLSPQHPRLALADAQVERARARRDRVAAARRAGPNLWLGGKSTRSGSSDEYESALGVELSIPLGSRAHHAPALAEAELGLTETEVERVHIQHELQDAIVLARTEHQQAISAQQTARRRQELATASLKLSRRAFELGETDLVRLLQVNADTIEARHALELRRLEVGQAVARLNQAFGEFPQ